MRKVDENLPNEVCDLLNRAGHDATSVGEQGVGGADDARIHHHCQVERRALTTLDVDFANVQTYEQSSAGVVVLRLAQQDRQRVLDAVASILPALKREPLRKRLWIVEGKRVRIRA
jgi:predicted nuclease of predicted toxin-antitoxin system